LHFDIQSSFSTKRVHSASCAWHGRPMPSQVGHGKDGRVCHLYSAATRSNGGCGPGQCSCDWPHKV